MPALVAKSPTVKALCWCVSSRGAWRCASNVHDSISRHEEAEHTHTRGNPEPGEELETIFCHLPFCLEGAARVWVWG